MRVWASVLMSLSMGIPLDRASLEV